MDYVIVIPARLASHRLPNKPLADICGKSMLEHTYERALEAAPADKVFIATDSDEIIKKFKKYNLEFIKRPKELNKEKYGVDEVMKYCLSYLSEKVEYACCLYACSPLISYQDIKKGFSKIKGKKYKYIFAASNFSHPVERSFKVDNGEIKMISKKFFNTSSKFFTETYHDTGYFYWAKADTWKNEFLSYSSKSSFIKIPNWRAQDLDTLDDLKKVDLILKSLKKK